jgi:hypothetical protein
VSDGTGTEGSVTAGSGATDGGEQAAPSGPQFILYLEGEQHAEAMQRLALWVKYLLLPVYGREVTSLAPWCSRWWEHEEVVAQLYGLWMAWQELTSADAGLSGPAVWHRDHLGHVMNAVRDPSGPFAGCKPGSHRAKEAPGADDYEG